LLIGLSSFGQTDSTNCVTHIDSITKQQVYNFVDYMPTPKGGQKELFKALKNINFQSSCSNYESVLYVAFIVNAHGEIEGKRVIKDIIGTDFSDQILSLVDSVEWNPGVCDSIAVPVVYILPVRIIM